MKKVFAGLCVAASMAAVSGAALAADSSYYAAVDVGQSTYGGWDAVCAATAGAATASCTKAPTGYRLAGGYGFNKNFGIEASYTDYGQATVSATGGGATVSGNMGSTAFQVVGTGALPLGEQFALTAKAGLAAISTKGAVVGTAPGLLLAVTTNQSKSNFVWGVGAQYDFTQTIGVRLNYEDLGSITAGTATLQSVSAGVVFKF